jgi:hypothetical protein
MSKGMVQQESKEEDDSLILEANIMSSKSISQDWRVEGMFKW